jgi:hypothetical protein
MLAATRVKRHASTVRPKTKHSDFKKGLVKVVKMYAKVTRNFISRFDFSEIWDLRWKIWDLTQKIWDLIWDLTLEIQIFAGEDLRFGMSDSIWDLPMTGFTSRIWGRPLARNSNVALHFTGVPGGMEGGVNLGLVDAAGDWTRTVWLWGKSVNH